MEDERQRKNKKYPPNYQSQNHYNIFVCQMTRVEDTSVQIVIRDLDKVFTYHRILIAVVLDLESTGFLETKTRAYSGF